MAKLGDKKPCPKCGKVAQVNTLDLDTKELVGRFGDGPWISSPISRVVLKWRCTSDTCDYEEIVEQ